jgi:hypothetical protein
MGIWHRGYGIGHRPPWAYLTFLRTAIAIVIKASTFSAETEVDYLVTNAVTDKARAQWIVTNYSQRKRLNNLGGGYI